MEVPLPLRCVHHPFPNRRRREATLASLLPNPQEAKMLPTTGDSQPLPAPPPAVRQLEDLPLDVLEKLLGGLPAAEVVRTSVLSETWRRRWESVPGLDIHLDDGVRDWESAAGFLSRCAAPVRGVSIRGVPLRLFDRADGWVRTVAGKRPRSLSVALPAPTELPSVFACDPAALAHLKLATCVLPPPPAAFAGFRGLTALDLDDVVFSGEKAWERLEAMISAAAPTLQKLRLVNIAVAAGGGGGGLPGAWIIQAPNLRWLELRLTMASAGPWELGHLPKLDYAYIELNAQAEQRDYAGLLTALSSVTELEIANFDCATFQINGITVQLAISCIFENLRILKLHTHFYESSTTLSTISLLLQAPVLQVLEITDNSQHEINKEVSTFAENFLKTLPNTNCSLVKNLELLHMKCISCSPNDMHFIRYVLLHARNLQMASVENFTGNRNSALDASRMLKDFGRASPAARICFKHGDFCWLA